MESLISLVIPVYNTERFLEKCFSSAIAQDYPNLEILILNNGSADNSQAIIDKYAAIDSRIVHYTIDHVQTVKESKDNCYYRSKGDWVITLDSDDYLEEGYVSALWKSQLKTGADCVVACMVGVDLEGNLLSKLPAKDFDYSVVYSGREAMCRTIKSWQFGLNGALIKKKCIVNNYLDNKNCLFYTDEFDGRMMLDASTKVAFCYTKYFHTHNPVSVGKKPGWNKYKYKVLTRHGLLSYVKQTLTVKSKEYNSLFLQSMGVVFLSIRFYIQNKKQISETEKNDYHETCKALIDSTELTLSLRSMLFNAPLKLFIKILFEVTG